MKQLKKFNEFIKKKYNELVKSINEVYGVTHSLRNLILFDMLLSYILHGCTHNDYKKLQFYSLNYYEKETFITFHRNKRILRKLKLKKTNKYLDNTEDFNEKFKEYTKRDITCIKKLSYKQFEELIEHDNTLTCKSSNNNTNEEVLNLNDYRGVGFMIKYMQDNKLDYILTKIEQNEYMKTINPNSLNHIKIVSLLNNNDIKLLYGIITIGTTSEYKNKLEENEFISGLINVSNGSVSEFLDHELNVCKTHPVSGVSLSKFIIPDYDKIVELINKAHREISNVKLITWDICLTEDGPILLDGDASNDYIYFQAKRFRVNNHGLMKYYISIG